MADDNVVEFQRRPINEWPKELFIADIEDGGGVRVYDHIQHPDDSTPRYVRADLHDATTKQRDELATEVERLTKLVSDSEKQRYRVCGELLARAEKAEAERDAALARAGAIIGRYFRCEGCGSTTDKPDAQLEWIKRHGGTSCCPERKMVSLAPDDAQAALDKLIADARAGAFKQAADMAANRGQQMFSQELRARINEPQEGV